MTKLLLHMDFLSLLSEVPGSVVVFMIPIPCVIISSFHLEGTEKTQELHEKYYIPWMAVARGISVPLNRIPFFLQIIGETIAFLTGVKHWNAERLVK